MPAGNMISFLRAAVIGVDGGRRHAPFLAVERLADLRDLALRLEIVGAQMISEQIAAA